MEAIALDYGVPMKVWDRAPKMGGEALKQMETAVLRFPTQVGPLYTLEKEGALKPGDRRAIAFTTARLAAGATAVRDMIVEAWLQSADTPVGYPMVNLRDIESGKVRATRDLFGKDSADPAGRSDD